LGSFSEHELRDGVVAGRFFPQDLVCAEGLANWEPLGQRLGLAVPPGQAPSHSPEPDLGMRMLLPVGRSMWAIAAGYMGIFSLLIFPAPFAVIVSLIAIMDIQRSKNSPKGRKFGMGRAIFGLVAGLVCSFAMVKIVLLMMSQP
jgi:hypothetical protein